MRLSIAALAAAVLAGCSDGPYSEQEKNVKSEVIRYFAELNAEAGVKAQAAKATKNDVDLPSTSLSLNRYDWDIAGAVYFNVVCSACQAKVGTLYTAQTDLRCPACNTKLKEEEHKGQPMFEIRSGTTPPIVVLFRYVRHSQAYDPNSAVMVSSKTEATNPIKPISDSEFRGSGAYYAGGLYRTTSSALCTTVFVFKGGALHQVDPKQVEKMIADPPETVAVNAMKLGRGGAIEKPLVPWLGKPPVETAAKEPPKSP